MRIYSQHWPSRLALSHTPREVFKLVKDNVKLSLVVKNHSTIEQSELSLLTGGQLLYLHE